MKTKTIFYILLVLCVLHYPAYSASITVLSPNGDEQIPAESWYLIGWTSVDVISDVRIDYSIDSGANWTRVVDQNIPNTGLYIWYPVPNQLTQEGLVRIYSVDDPNIEDTSDWPFYIYECQYVFYGDNNMDCYINFRDFTILADEWLRCGNPMDPSCRIECPDWSADCDGFSFNACECFFPNAQALCDDANCVMGDCLPGYSDLNDDPNDGCENIYPCEWVSDTDVPDDDFIDADCDGIDGKKDKAVFVAVTGDDGNPGTTSTFPKRTVQEGINAAVATGRDYVLISQGTYNETVTLESGVSLYGSYNAPTGWDRSASYTTSIAGDLQGLNGDSVSGVTIAHLDISSANVASGQSSYAVFLKNASNINIHRCTIEAGNGGPGSGGSSGSPGQSGGSGYSGRPGCEDSTWPCSSCSRPLGGDGGISPVGYSGGRGGNAGHGSSWGSNGYSAPYGDGAGGAGGAPSSDAGNGTDGSPGSYGTDGMGGIDFGTADASGYNVAASGGNGTIGQPGRGGGGGGGGGGGSYSCDSYGSSGGGGGGGGAPGGAAQGGASAGGSFGVWLYLCTSIEVTDCIIRADGGVGGSGGIGGAGGSGGYRGARGYYGGSSEQDDGGMGGYGGYGGSGGRGGHGGGGGGGPSIGILIAAGTTPFQSGNTFNLSAGPGGSSAGNPGPPGVTVGVYSP